MKIFIIKLLFFFYIAQGLTVKNTSKKHKHSLTPIPRPPYYTNSSITYYYENRINNRTLVKILTHISKFTCLNFTRKNDTPINNSIGINFFISKNGNNVSLSNSTDMPTNVSLEKKVYRNHKNLSFYVGLALGMIPEIRRLDRFQEVLVNMSNVNETFKQFFKKANLSDVPYINSTDFDVESPMLFDPYFGSINGYPTYTVKLYKTYQPYFGNGSVFRHNDYKHLSYCYCNITKIKNKCKYGGYKLKTGNFSSRCKCPEHLTGRSCAKLKNNTATNCTSPRNLTANSTKQFLIVENANGSCYFNITAQNKNKKVRATVEKIVYKENNCTNSSLYLEVLFRNDKGAKGLVLCRNSTKVKIPSVSNEVFVVFNGDEKANFLNISYKEVNRTRINSTQLKENEAN